MANDEQGWRVGKEIPVATIVVLLLQTASALWWAASVTADIRYVRETQVAHGLTQVQIDRRQDEDAKRSEDRFLVQFVEMNRKLDRLVETKREQR